VVKESVLDFVLYNLAREKEKGGIKWFRSLAATPVTSGVASLTIIHHAHICVTSEEFVHLSAIHLERIRDSSRTAVNHT
jgi:hypothetical protein